MKLTPDQCNATANAMRVAAERYADDARHLRANAPLQDHTAPYLRLAEQFDRQEREALALAEIFEDEAQS